MIHKWQSLSSIVVNRANQAFQIEGVFCFSNQILKIRLSRRQVYFE